MKIIQSAMVDTWYHSVLRVAVAVVAVVLLFSSGVLMPATRDIAYDARLHIANTVGVQASVQPTELNQYTAMLTQREQELVAREAALEQREISVGLNSGARSANTDYSNYILASILFIMLVLIVLNYTLDFIRSRPAVATRQSVTS